MGRDMLLAKARERAGLHLQMAIPLCSEPGKSRGCSGCIPSFSFPALADLRQQVGGAQGTPRAPSGVSLRSWVGGRASATEV